MTERDDRDALDKIGALLAGKMRWSGYASILDALAEIIAETGRPHPAHFPKRGIGDYLQVVRAERIWNDAAPSARRLAQVVADLCGELGDNAEYDRACREIVANYFGAGLGPYVDRVAVDHLIHLAKEN